MTGTRVLFVRQTPGITPELPVTICSARRSICYGASAVGRSLVSSLLLSSLTFATSSANGMQGGWYLPLPASLLRFWLDHPGAPCCWICPWPREYHLQMLDCHLAEPIKLNSKRGFQLRTGMGTQGDQCCDITTTLIISELLQVYPHEKTEAYCKSDRE